MTLYIEHHEYTLLIYNMEPYPSKIILCIYYSPRDTCVVHLQHQLLCQTYVSHAKINIMEPKFFLFFFLYLSI